MRTINLDVGGMRCRRCVRLATALLRDVPGVATLVADPRTSRIAITGDVTEHAVLQALAASNFSVRVTSPTPRSHGSPPSAG
jgi:copper chaperone CopZ